jgi:UDP-N-acetylglucosamine 2-epimerase (non-hydrolysing)
MSVKKKNIILITCHRRENIGDPLTNLCNSVKKLSHKYTDYKFIFCVHPNPTVKNTVHDILKSSDCMLENNLPYDKFIEYVLHAKIIITDSYG